MNRIARRMQELKERQEAAFIPFITGGDPDLTGSEQVAVALAEAGADIIEYGVPFSDPVGDGIVIQEASLRALSQGVTLRKMLDSVRRIRERSDVPLMLFSYFNPILVYGVEDFARDAAAAGVDGVLCVDLPPDDAEVYRCALKDQGMEAIFLAAPTSTDERLKFIGDACDSFVYYISRLGVTGEQVALSEGLTEAVARVRRLCDRPVAVGFGISTPEQARLVAGVAEGVVIGSAIVRLIARHGASPDLIEKVSDFGRQLSDAIKKG
jgi:tryptophan synthase alpha chain